MKGSVLTVAILLASTASASTYVVDAAGGAGSQFTSIATAIAASVPGDVLIVRPGNYAPFTVDRGIVLVGGANVLVTGNFTVSGIPLGARAAVAGFGALGGIAVTNCDGAVLLQDVSALSTTTVTNSRDVRCARLQGLMAPPQVVSACEVDSSRVELLDSSLEGCSHPWTGAVNGANGTRGLVANNASMHLTNTSVKAGGGQYNDGPNVYAGDGADGIRMFGTAVTRLVGSTVFGGAGALNWYYNHCEYDGHAGTGVSGGTLYISTSTVTAYSSQIGIHCITDPASPFTTNLQQVFPEDPALRVLGNPAAGQIVTFEISGPLGSSVDLVVGRTCIVQSSPPLVDALSSRERVFALGVIPASGKIQMPLVIPSYLPAGFVIVSQAEVVVPGGALRRSNSAPLIVR